LKLALLLIAYGTSDNAAVQEALEDFKKGLQLTGAWIT